MTDKKLMQMTLDCMETAIKAGDWAVDGACDPDMVLQMLRARLAQPIIDDEIKGDKTEPVAYDKSALNSFVQDLYDKKLGEGKQGLYETLFHVVHAAIERVHAPPQREWVGLTDEEITETLIKQHSDARLSHFQAARAIEARLKEKNHA